MTKFDSVKATLENMEREERKREEQSSRFINDLLDTFEEIKKLSANKNDVTLRLIAKLCDEADGAHTRWYEGAY